MSMMYTPSLAPGARTLPINLRDPRAGSHGLYRLHGNMAPVTEYPMALSGFGDISCDENGVCTDDGTGSGTVLVGVGPLAPGETYDPVDLASIQAAAAAAQASSATPVTVTTANPDGSTSTQSMTPAQLAALISSSASSLTKVLAITQGGSVLANGTIIGSSTAAQLAAQQSALSLSAAGLTGLFSNPIVPIALIGVLAVMMISRK